MTKLPMTGLTRAFNTPGIAMAWSRTASATSLFPFSCDVCSRSRPGTWWMYSTFLNCSTRAALFDVLAHHALGQIAPSRCRPSATCAARLPAARQARDMVSGRRPPLPIRPWPPGQSPSRPRRYAGRPNDYEAYVPLIASWCGADLALVLRPSPRTGSRQLYGQHGVTYQLLWSLPARAGPRQRGYATACRAIR